eukprot:Tbor_TRINITY_DN5402_c0_g1::TRINITY_DN5402_c0_g1_i1::g.24248::m.24248
MFQSPESSQPFEETCDVIRDSDSALQQDINKDFKVTKETDLLRNKLNVNNDVIGVEHMKDVNNNIMVNPSVTMQSEKQQLATSLNATHAPTVPKKRNLDFRVTYAKWDKFDPRDYGCESSDSDHNKIDKDKEEDRYVSQMQPGNKETLDAIAEKEKMEILKRKRRRAEKRVMRSTAELKRRVCIGITIIVMIIISFLIFLIFALPYMIDNTLSKKFKY